MSEQKGIFHVSRDGWTIDANTSIYMYYDKDHADNTTYIGAIDTVAGRLVWDGDHKAVWHLSEASGIRYDSKGSNDLADINTVLQADGKIGKAADFEKDTEEELSINDNADLSMGDIDFTFELWFKLETNGFWQNLIRKDDGVGNREYLLALGDDNKLYYGVPAGVTGATVGTYNIGTWYYIAFYHDAAGNVMGIQTNDAAPDETAIVGGFPDATAPFLLGTFNTISQWLDGIEDEVRISKTLRSVAWRKGSYNSGNDSLLTYGSEETEAADNAIFFGTNL